MYISEITIKNFRCFDEPGICFKLNKGLTALVGENDSGKTAIIDAIRYTLGTTDNNWNRLEESDFYNDDANREITIILKFSDLNKREQAAFLEHLTYVENDGKWDTELYINYSASVKKATGREYIQTTLRSGKNCDGPELEALTKLLLNSTYLQPLRDAEKSLSSGRNSRLSQILKNIQDINAGNKEYTKGGKLESLSISAILELADKLLAQNVGIQTAKQNIDKVLEEKLLLTNSDITSTVNVASENLSDDRKLIAMLEKLNLGIKSSKKEYGKLGLGTNNILYMACELLLMNQNEEAYKLLLIEEPEAHIHVQRQMKIIKSLQDESSSNGRQVILSTHSPQLASSIKLENLIYVQNSKVFSMGENFTRLDKSDYKFLERFLDATKANLFFAKGVVIVEGDAENILLPTISKILGRDFADYGVSIVNVGGVGLRRYAKIFQRQNDDDPKIDIPVACITDADILPDCAPAICKNIVYADPEKWPPKRKWKVRSEVDFSEIVKQITNKSDGQKVKTFVSDNWTLEYDLAFAGLSCAVYIAATLALNDDEFNSKPKKRKDIIRSACGAYRSEVKVLKSDEEKCSKIYALFTRKNASKPIAAQYLSSILDKKYKNNPQKLYGLLPKYIIDAIEYVTEKIPFDTVEGLEK